MGLKIQWSNLWMIYELENIVLFPKGTAEYLQFGSSAFSEDISYCLSLQPSPFSTPH